MDNTDKIKTDASKQEDLVRCQECNAYLKKTEGFRCPKCKRTPLCRSHKAIGSRECTKCAIDIRADEINKLRKEVAGISNFIKFLHFMFLLYAIFFISTKIGLKDILEFLQDNIVVDNFIYLGGVIILGYLIMYIILFSQRDKIKKLEAELDKIGIRRQF